MKVLCIHNNNVRQVPNEGGLLNKLFDIVLGDYDCRYAMLTSLKNCPSIIYGNFYCNNNQLTSLKYSPFYVKKDFSCFNNEITSLEGISSNIRGDIDASNNSLKNLIGLPSVIFGRVEVSYNEFTSLEGYPTAMFSKIYIDEDYIVNESLKIEEEFARSRFYKNLDKYYEELYKYCVDKKIGLYNIKSWPEDFLNDNEKKSDYCVGKFNL